PIYRFNRGMSFVELKRYSDASSDIDHWIAKSPKDPWGYIYRGIVKTETMQFRGGIDDFDLAVRNGGSASFISAKLSSLSEFYFGPTGISYENSVKYTLRTLDRLNREFFPLSDEQKAERLQKLFPDRVFNKRDVLFMWESGIGPLLIKKVGPDVRATNAFYYAELVATLSKIDPNCSILIKSLDEVVAGLAAAKDVTQFMKERKSTLEGILGGIVMGTALAINGELARKDAVMLLSRYGCSHDVVINIVKNGSIYLNWSMAL
ncbi:MAG TPA: hypothetical protein VJQ25_00095, partial [Nitrospira sp.]|nr:hypothetical protein [Nitrospira sp.]